MSAEIDKEHFMNEIEEILNKLLSSVPELVNLFMINLNGNILYSYLDKNHEFPIKEFIFTIITHIYSQSKTIKLIKGTQAVEKGHIENNEEFQFLYNCENGYLFVKSINPSIFLILRTLRNTRLGIVFLDSARTRDKILKLFEKYQVSEEFLNSINIGAKLDIDNVAAAVPHKISDEGQIGNKRIRIKKIRPKKDIKESLDKLESKVKKTQNIFFSYAKADSKRFKIKELATGLEALNSKNRVRYFERDIKPGQEMMEYMEEGVKWCDFFIYFYSDNSKNSIAVDNEYKMATFLGKRIIPITMNYNILPLSARIRHPLLWKDDVSEMTKKIEETINKLNNFNKNKEDFKWLFQILKNLVNS
ncbi:MAG: TIR domain-containing protein [Promethearchaeota archaeon]